MLAKAWVQFAAIIVCLKSGYVFANGQDKGKQFADLLSSLLKGYDKQIRPNFGYDPVVVDVELAIADLLEVSDFKQEFTADIKFAQQWTDPRLAFDQNATGFAKLYLDGEFAKRIWLPDTQISKARKLELKGTTDLQDHNEKVVVKPNGEIYRRVSLKLTATCHMYLRLYPMDTQLCSITLGSYSLTAEDIEYRWLSPHAVSVYHNVYLPQFRVYGHGQRNRSVILRSGRYTSLVVNIVFDRGYFYHVLQVFAPSAMIVMISWISFWLNKDKRSDRVSLLFTTVLTITLFMVSVNSGLPEINYVKAIDVYLIMCFFFVFAALLEYSVMIYLSNRRLTSKQNELRSRGIRTYQDKALAIDRYSRVVFPFTFLIFNIGYWSYYLNAQELYRDSLDTIYYEF